MSVPSEFFSRSELADILDTPQKKRQCQILKKNNVPFVSSADGHPRVYRDKLLPQPKSAQNATFDFSILSGRRKAKETQE